MFGGDEYAAIILSASVVVAAVYDFRYRLIPNKLTYFLLITGVVLSIFDGRVSPAFMAFGLCVAIVFPFYLAGALGGADLKLLAGVSLFGDWLTFVECLIITVLLGAFWGLASLAPGASRRALRFVCNNGSAAAQQSAEQLATDTIPLACPIALAVFCTHTIDIRVLV